MDSDNGQTSSTDRRVVRRGLLAGLAGLGAAAALKLTGQAKPLPAEAAPAALQYPAAAPDTATFNTAYNVTNLQAPAGATTDVGPLLKIDQTPASGGLRHALFAYAYGNGSVGMFGVGGLAGSGVGVAGQGGGPGGAGMTGEGGANGFGVAGIGGNASPSSGTGGMGVRATGGASGTGTGGVGLRAFGGFSSSGTSGAGVFSTSNNGKGVYGQSTSSDGVHGHSTSGVGLRGTSQGFVGLVGISDNSTGLYGFNQAGGVPAFVAENLAASGSRIAGYFNGHVEVHGNFTVFGAKNAAVAMPDGSDAVVYCQESPEPYFEDFGRAQLVNGVAHVQLEAEFASIVKRDDYMVFVTPGGDSNGLYVGQQTPQGFEVREQKGGKSNLPFTYRVVARRKDIEGKRLARLDPQVKQNLTRMRRDSSARTPAVAGLQRSEAPLVPHEPVTPDTSPPPEMDPRLKHLKRTDR